jgi:hypothetical protein
MQLRRAHKIQAQCLPATRLRARRRERLVVVVVEVVVVGVEAEADRPRPAGLLIGLAMQHIPHEFSLWSVAD